MGGEESGGGAGDNAFSAWDNTSQTVSRLAAKVATVERGRLELALPQILVRESTCAVVSSSTSACALKAKARLSDIHVVSGRFNRRMPFFVVEQSRNARKHARLVKLLYDLYSTDR